MLAFSVGIRFWVVISFSLFVHRELDLYMEIISTCKLMFVTIANCTGYMLRAIAMLRSPPHSSPSVVSVLG